MHLSTCSHHPPSPASQPASNLPSDSRHWTWSSSPNPSPSTQRGRGLMLKGACPKEKHRSSRSSRFEEFLVIVLFCLFAWTGMCRGSIGYRLLGFVPSIQSLRIAACGIQLCACYLCSVHLPTFRRVQGYMGPNSSSNNYLGSRCNGLITDRKL